LSDAPQVAESAGAADVDDDEQARKDIVDGLVDHMKKTSAQQGRPLVQKKPRTEEEELDLQRRAREYLAADGVQPGDTPMEIVEMEEAPMRDDPATKYRVDKTLALEVFDRGDIHLMEDTCTSLLARQPDDTEVWRTLTASRLRMNLWDSALEAARRWIAFDPYAILPRNAECVALVGCGQFGEARARFALLADEIEDMDVSMATELRECVKRVDELWITPEPGKAVLSSRPANIIVGARPPHFYLPNFADSVGPVKVLNAELEELGGGQSHFRKVVVTRDVAAGDLLFVQNPLVFGAVEREEHMDRLSDAMLTAATTSSRAAKLLTIMADDEKLPENNSVAETIADPSVVRAEPFSKDADKQKYTLLDCRKVLERSRMFTGRAYCGVWTLPGMSRHSCIPSANFTCFGDALIARAARNLKEGDEVTFAYWDVMVPVESRQKAMTEQCGGFWCRCPRCEAESNLNIAAETASKALQNTFDECASRVNAIKEELMFKIESKKKGMEKRYDAFNSKDEKQYREGLVGLADKFRNLNGRVLNDGDLAEVKEFLPEMYEENMVKVPPDLANQLMDAVIDFERAIDAANLSDEQQAMFLASHMSYYSEVLVLMRILKDLEAQRFLVSRMLPSVAFVAPGSFTHQRLSVLNWEIAAQCEDPDVTPGAELAPREKEMARDCIKLRYGADLNPMEQEAAMARVSCSREIDENWCWEVSWCIGRFPMDIPTDWTSDLGDKEDPAKSAPEQYRIET